VGCILGVKNGLAGIDAGPDWRGPVADRLYLATAEGGRAVTDTVRETIEIVNMGRGLQGQAPIAPKNGARFNFALPGSVQGFQPLGDNLSLENVSGHSRDGSRSLALRYNALGTETSACAVTPVFVPPEAITMGGYELVASPALYPGQTLGALLAADATNTSPVTAKLIIEVYTEDDQLRTVEGPTQSIAGGGSAELSWTLPSDIDGPIARTGVQLTGAESGGTVYLDWLRWDGTPDLTFTCPEGLPRWMPNRPMWQRAWVDGVDQFGPGRSNAFDLIQNQGRGLISQGTRDWTDYTASAPLHVYVAGAAGLGVRVQGMKRYYALLLCDDGKARLVKALDGDRTLAESDFTLETDHDYDLKLEVDGTRLRGWIDGTQVFDVEDTDRPLDGGAVALLCENGRIHANSVSVKPLAQ
jgi:hypothetical protein